MSNMYFYLERIIQLIDEINKGKYSDEITRIAANKGIDPVIRKLAEEITFLMMKVQESNKKITVLSCKLKDSTEQLREYFLSSISLLIKILESKDRYTKGHSERVSYLVEKMGECSNSDANLITRLKIAGLLHDIGKVGVSEFILNKPGKLSVEEFSIVKKHPVLGYEILKILPHMKVIAEIVKYHHENFDGSGYPEGLKGEEIPIEARMIHVADAYDALTSPRAYRQKKTSEEAISIITLNAGKQFDPKCVDYLLHVVS